LREFEDIDTKIAGLEVFALTAPDDDRPHWVSHFIAPRASEVLVRLRTSQGVEGFGLATSYTAVGQIVEAFRSGIGEQIVGMDPLAPERLHQKLFALTSQRLAHERGWPGVPRPHCCCGRYRLLGHHWQDRRPAALSTVRRIPAPRALLRHVRLLPR
jgi:hypothetical protein